MPLAAAFPVAPLPVGPLLSSLRAGERRPRSLPMKKVVKDAAEAVKDIPDGASIMV